MTSILYNDLITLISASELVPGEQYRITDYVTTISKADYTSGNHVFDVVVTALDTNTLYDYAKALQHEGDTYFDGVNFSLWSIKYNIDNIIPGYTNDWVDPFGKGCIYYMADEFANEAPYDFKNIKHNGKYLYSNILGTDNSLHGQSFDNSIKDLIVSGKFTIPTAQYTGDCYNIEFGYNCDRLTVYNSHDVNLGDNNYDVTIGNSNVIQIGDDNNDVTIIGTTTGNIGSGNGKLEIDNGHIITIGNHNNNVDLGNNNSGTVIGDNNNDIIVGTDVTGIVIVDGNTDVTIGNDNNDVTIEDSTTVVTGDNNTGVTVNNGGTVTIGEGNGKLTIDGGKTVVIGNNTDQIVIGGGTDIVVEDDVTDVDVNPDVVDITIGVDDVSGEGTTTIGQDGSGATTITNGDQTVVVDPITGDVTIVDPVELPKDILRYSPQTLTPEQQLQARTNIGADAGITDSPTDGLLYGRKDGDWEEIDIPEIIDAYTKTEVDTKLDNIEHDNTLNKNSNPNFLHITETEKTKFVATSDFVEDFISNATAILYADLLALINNNELIPSSSYRITNYTTTTTQADTQSAGHDFDIIVTALSTNKLSENAKCVRKAGDTYFTNAKVENWEIKYCLDNDTTRFAFADSVNGKGVIYYMKDENGNELPYDFKNIQYLKGGVWIYTFGGAADNSLVGGCYNNIIKEYISSGKQTLNNNTFGDGCWSNKFGNDCYSNTFDGDCYLNTFDYGCHSNTFGVSCENNTFDSYCRSNTLGYSCYSNTFGSYCSSNIINDDCYSNTFGYSCYQNTFGNECYSNAFGDGCYTNEFGGGCYSNKFGDSCHSNEFGDVCYNNVFGSECQSNTFGTYCIFNTFGDNCRSNAFDDDCNSNTFGIGCTNNEIGAESTSNTFSDYCDSNTFGAECRYNNFGTSCDSNTFGDECSSNKLSNDCNNNTFGDSCYSNVFGTDSDYNTFGNYCQLNTFGNNCASNNFYQGLSGTTPKNYMKFIVLEDGVQKNNFYSDVITNASAYLQRIIIKGFANTGTPLATTILLTATNTDYNWVVAKDSNGIVQQYCPEDLTDAGIPDAPVDDKTYGRKNGGWSEITTSGGGGGTSTVSITWSSLKSLRDAGTLVPGQSYRITDYVCTTTTTNSRAVSNLFDIIVTALDASHLSENASATYHTGDTYFSSNNAKLESWELKYCLDNDTSRFEWVNASTGKGVIYYMKDNHNNEVPYDFKNIQYLKNSVWLYTFGGGIDNSVVASSTSKYCFNNIIGVYRAYVSQILKYKLTFNTFGDNCNYNTFGNDYCQYNNFGNNCQSNTFGYYCHSTTFGDNCNHNTFGDSCIYNTFGNSCQYNTFGNSSSSNTFGVNCDNNTFGDECLGNTFGNYCTNNTFGDNCNYNNFYTGTSGDTKIDYMRWIVLEDGVRYNNFYSTLEPTSSSYLQRIRIKGLSGTSGTRLVTQITLSSTNTKYDWTICYTSGNVLKQYCPADLV